MTLPPNPFPYRFATAEAGAEFQRAFAQRLPRAEMEQITAKLAVPPFILVDGAGQRNPAYEAAQFEWTLQLA